MKTARTLAVVAAALLVFAAAGCGTSDSMGAGDTSTTAAPETSTTEQAVTTTEQAITTTTAAPEETTTTTAATPTPSPDDGLAEEYAVYSALVQTLYIDATRPKLIVIEDTTAKSGSSLFALNDAIGFMRHQWPELDDDILADFRAKNQTPSTLVRRFELSVDYIFISLEELESIFSKRSSGWDDFYVKYPDSQGVLTLSRAGFDEERATAVVYAGNQSHWVAGQGGMVLLEKKAGLWTVKSNSWYWVS